MNKSRSSNAERQARFRQRQHEAGRRRVALWVTDAERDAIEIELMRLRSGPRFAAALAEQRGIECADLRVADTPAADWREA